MPRTATSFIGNDTLLERELPSDTAHPRAVKIICAYFFLFIRLFMYFDKFNICMRTHVRARIMSIYARA